jgi:RNA polymerase sigma-70 factor (ECF subfamily)
MLVGETDTAQDIVQEAFVRLWQSPRVPRDRQGFKSWLYRTVTNLTRDHRRRTQRWARLPIISPPPPVDPQQEAVRRWSSANVDEALRSLPEREREALYLRFFEDAPYDEVGKILGMRAGACRVLVHRALKKLQDRMVADGSFQQTGA